MKSKFIFAVVLLCGIGFLTSAQAQIDGVTAQRSFQSSLESGFVPEEEITVQLTVANSSDSVQEVAVEETVPEGFTVVSAEGGDVNGQAIGWTVTAAEGDTVLTYTVKAPVEHIDPATPRLFVWQGTVGGAEVAGTLQLNLIYNETPGQFDYHADIGDVDGQGYVNFIEDSGEYEIEGSGADIWNNNDEFQFVFNEMSGSLRIRANVILTPQDHEWSMAGIMVRDNLSVGSPQAAGRIRRDGADYQSAWRDNQDGGSGEASEGLVSGIESDDPQQEGVVELERIGSNVSYYYYDMEGNRVLHTSKNIAGGLTDPIYVGLFTTSHIDGQIGFSIISDVVVETMNLDADAARSLAEKIQPDQDLKGVTVTANVRSGNPVVTETIPEGWALVSHSADGGNAVAQDGSIVWDLSGVTGTATLVYDLSPQTAETEVAWFEGTLKEGSEEQAVAGVSVAFYRDGYETNAPYLDKSIVLDGKIGEDEWDGATTHTFDRVESDPQEHLVFGVNKPFDESHTTFHVFHNDEYIFLGIDVLDLDVNPDLSNVWESDGAEVSWNGNFSQRADFTSDRESFQSIVAADGDRAIGQFVPTVEPLEDGSGYFSQDGEVWNFGGALKEDGTGYVTEYAVNKGEILDPIDIKTIGWSLSTNDAIADQTRESRYALHMVDPNTGLTVESYAAPRNWGLLHLWTDSTFVADWSLY